MSGSGDGVIYTTREMFDDIKKTLDEIKTKLDTKADVAAVQSMSTQLSTMTSQMVYRDGPLMRGLEGRLGEVEKVADEYRQNQAANVALSGWQRWFFGVICFGLFGVIVTLVTLTMRLH